MTGDVEREGFAFIGGLISDRGGRRAFVADLKVKGLADCLAMGIGCRHLDRTVAVIAVGWHAGDDSGMGIDAETGGQRSRESQGIARGGSLEVAGNVEREGLAFIGSLICDRSRRRAFVTDLKVEGLADRHAMGVGRRHGDYVVAEVAVGRHARNDAGVCIDAETGRQRSRESQGIARGGSLEVAGDVEREGLAFIGSLICDRSRRRAFVTDLKVEGLADRHAMGIGRRYGDCVVAEVAVGWHAGDDSGMCIDAETGRQ